MPNPLAAVAQRCAVHPSRSAVDSCPTCDRPRCGADGRSGLPGCLACRPTLAAPAPLRSPQTGPEPYVRAALGGSFAAVVGGLVTSEYIGAPYFAYIAPFLVGVLCGAVMLRAAGTTGAGTVGRRVRALALVYAALGVGVGFKLVPGGGSPWSPVLEVVPAYVCAVLGAVLWTWPAKRRPMAPNPAG